MRGAPRGVCRGGQHAKEQQIPFPVYGLKDTKDLFKIQDLMKKAGTSDWMASGVYGGTTLVLDHENWVELKLEKDGTRPLPEKLAALRD